MKVHHLFILSSIGVAFFAACSSSDNGGSSGSPSGGSGGTNTSGSSGAASGPSGNSDMSSGTSNGGSGGGSGSSGTGPSGASMSGGSGMSGSQGSGGSTGTASDQGANGVPCGAMSCRPPNSCCQSATSSGDAGANPVCVVSCTSDQVQLCVTDADCQSSGTAICQNGTCFDPGSDAGTDDVYVAPLEGGPPPPPTDAGKTPTGYPTPTAATRMQCQTTMLGQGPGASSGLCPGGGSGPVCIECLFGGSTYDNSTGIMPSATAISEAGNYLVTVQLGGAAAGTTYISAEANRALLGSTATTAGQSTEYSFVVNVRQREGQPEEAVANGYPGLDLFFSGTNPQISAIGYSLVTPATKPVMVYIASDSTVCDQTDQAYAGWGQALPEYFAPPVGISNYADSGESSSSFMGSNKWGAIKARWTAGDWLLVQFGHNDKSVSDAVVQANLETYITQAQAANVTPIVISPPARVQMTNNVEDDQSSLHAAAAKAAAAAKNVAYIDLTTLTTAWYNSLHSKTMALSFHANNSDATHTNMAGAVKIAGLVAGAMSSQNIPLAKYLR